MNRITRQPALVAFVFAGSLAVASAAHADRKLDARPASMPQAAMQGLLTAAEASSDAAPIGLSRIVFNLQNESSHRPNEHVADINDWLHPDWIIRGDDGTPTVVSDDGTGAPVAPLPSPALLAGAGLLTLAGARRRR